MAYQSVRIKGFLQKIWHMDATFMAYEPPPFMPYEPFLLGVGVVSNLLIKFLSRALRAAMSASYRRTLQICTLPGLKDCSKFKPTFARLFGGDLFLELPSDTK